jgi:hypothetical protein
MTDQLLAAQCTLRTPHHGSRTQDVQISKAVQYVVAHGPGYLRHETTCNTCIVEGMFDFRTSGNTSQ